MSKYGNKKVVFNDITFDSKMEYDYYKMLLLQDDIEDIILQPKYLLLDSYEIEGKKIRPIYYKADFFIKYKDGKEAVVDIKGFETADFKLKKKMFESKYGIKLHCISYSKIDGGFIELDQLKKNRALRKKQKNK